MPTPARAIGPSGPELLSGYDMAAIIEKVVGHRVRPVEMPLWMFLKVARMQGVDPFLLSGLRHYLHDHRSGAFEFDGGTNDVVFELTGRPAEDFDTIARRYAAMPFARQTPGNRLRALVNFLRVPFHPGYNLDRNDRRERQPVPPSPRLSMDDERWRADHCAAIGRASCRSEPVTSRLTSSPPRPGRRPCGSRPFLPR